jgi:hypothetical protein
VPPPPVERPNVAAPAPAATAEAQQVQTAVAFLLAKAAEGAQPDLFADYVLENVPEALLTSLESQRDPVAFLAQHFPQIGAYRPWFQRLVDSLYDDAAIENAGGADDVPVPNGGAQRAG